MVKRYWHLSEQHTLDFVARMNERFIGGRMSAKMFTATLIFALAGMASLPADPPQLLVVGETADCRPAPRGWNSERPFSIATAELVAEDLSRYFAGLDFLATSIMGAATRGVVRFCTEAEESLVLEALAEAVVRPLKSEPDVELDYGAKMFLEGWASPALVEALDAFEAADSAEALRRKLALELVRSTLEVRTASPRAVRPAALVEHLNVPIGAGTAPGQPRRALKGEERMVAMFSRRLHPALSR